jgi:hypothetical protein
MPQAYPPQRGIDNRVTKENARTASLAVVMTGALPPYPRDLTHWGRQQGWGFVLSGRRWGEIVKEKAGGVRRRRIVPYGSADGAAMALALGIAEPKDVLASLIGDIRARGNALSAGDVGYRFVLRALADAGRSDVVFEMNNQSDRPGYGMQLKRGATSLTAKWDASAGSFGSQDHFMLGQINEWFFHDLAGIQPDPAAPGFSRILIKPAIVGDLTWLKATYYSNRGKISVDWKRQDGTLNLAVTIPPDASATIYVPSHDLTSVFESGRPITSTSGVTAMPGEPGSPVK